MKFILSILLVFTISILVVPTGAYGEPLNAISIFETVTPDIVACINIESTAEDVNLPEIVLKTYVVENVVYVTAVATVPKNRTLDKLHIKNIESATYENPNIDKGDKVAVGLTFEDNDTTNDATNLEIVNLSEGGRVAVGELTTK